MHNVVPPSPLSVSRSFLSSHTGTLCPFNNHPPRPRPSPSASVSWHLPRLGTSGKWDRTVFAILLLACFMEHAVLKAHPWGRVCQNVFSFLSVYFSTNGLSAPSGRCTSCGYGPGVRWRPGEEGTIPQLLRGNRLRCLSSRSVCRGGPCRCASPGPAASARRGAFFRHAQGALLSRGAAGAGNPRGLTALGPPCFCFPGSR